MQHGGLFLKSILLILFFSVSSATLAQALPDSATYKLSKWECLDGSLPFSSDVIERMLSSSFLKIKNNQLSTIFKFEDGCEISWIGLFNIDKENLHLSEMSGATTSACNYKISEKEPAISFNFTTTQNNLILTRGPSIGDSCETGSVRIYSQINVKRSKKNTSKANLKFYKIKKSQK